MKVAKFIFFMLFILFIDYKQQHLNYLCATILLFYCLDTYDLIVAF